VGVAEEQNHRLAAEIGERPRLAVVVGQGEFAAVARAGDVGRLELRAVGTAAGGHGDGRGDQRRPDPARQPAGPGHQRQ
jgi:hypothetical protein